MKKSWNYFSGKKRNIMLVIFILITIGQQIGLDISEGGISKEEIGKFVAALMAAGALAHGWVKRKARKP